MSVPGPSTSTGHVSQMTNYARIGHAAQQLFPDILQEVIATKEPQHHLYGDVSSNRYLSRNFRADEWVMINNVRTNGYISFDVPLIYKLIRNLNLVPPPTKGWDYPIPPTITELLPGDDIERIRRTRNEILHRGNANVPDNELSDYFSIFKYIADRLEVYLGKPHGAFVTRFEVLESCCIDEKTEKEYLDRLQKLVEKENKLSKLVEDLQKNVGKLMYKDMHKLEVAEWEEQNKLFIKTEAVDYVIQSLKDKPCCTVTGTSGVGKSATIHHIALYLRDTEGYLIFPCHCPSDIEKYFMNDRKQVFIIDDICGRYTAIQTDVEEWMKWSVSIDRVMKKGHVKLLASCRLQVFNEKQFQRLKRFVVSSCNLSSEPFLLSVEQKVHIALQYLSEDIVDIIKNTLNMYDFLPLMFALFKARCERNEFVEADTFFRNPFDKYKEEVDELKNLDDKTKYCALFLLVINNGFIDVSSFTSEESYSKKKIRKEIFEVCGISRSTLRERIIEQLESLVNLFVKESFVGGNGKAYTTIHDKTFDFLCCYFGENLQKPFIKFSDRRILLERTQLVSVRGQKEEFSVSINEENEDAYFERVLNDLINQSPTELLYSKQMRCKEFRSKLIDYMRLDNERVKQMIIPNAFSESKITFSYNEDGCAGRLPVSSLHLTFKLEYMDIALFLLKQIKDTSADNFSLLLNKAASFGDRIIVEILLNKGTNPNNTDEIKWSPLMTACNFGHREIVDLLLKNHANVNTADDFGWSPLIRACGNGNEEIVKILIEKGADLTKTDKFGISALMLATENNHKSIVDILLNYSAITYTINNKTRPPLILACEKGNIEIIRSLVNKGADVNLTDIYGGTPFTSAFNKFGDENVLKLLIDKDININDPDIIRYSLLTLACERSKSEIVDFLIQKGVDVNVSDSNGNTPLFVACNKNNAKIVKLLVDQCEIVDDEIVKLLIDKGSNVNVAGRNGNISLILTCKGNTDEIVKLVLDKGGNINVANSNGSTPLILDCYRNNDEIVQLLMDKCEDINAVDSRGDTPLIVACRENNDEIVKLLINKGANVNIADEHGNSPLLWACRRNNDEIVELLIDKGANVNDANEQGDTPFIWACVGDNGETVRLHIDKGANVNCVDSCGNTPLILACRRNNDEIVKLLIDKGANVNFVDSYGNTPLILACWENNDEIVKLLIDKGANVNVVDNDGDTPLIFACRRGSEEMVKLILNKDANVNATDINGMNPVMYACKLGFHNIVALLLQKGANTSARNQDGNTVQVLAIESNDEQTRNFILDTDCNHKITGGSSCYGNKRKSDTELFDKEEIKKHL